MLALATTDTLNVMQIGGAASRHVLPDMSGAATESQDATNRQPPDWAIVTQKQDETEFSIDALRRGEIAIQNLEACRSLLSDVQLLFSPYERS